MEAVVREAGGTLNTFPGWVREFLDNKMEDLVLLCVEVRPQIGLECLKASQVM